MYIVNQHQESTHPISHECFGSGLWWGRPRGWLWLKMTANSTGLSGPPPPHRNNQVLQFRFRLVKQWNNWSSYLVIRRALPCCLTEPSDVLAILIGLFILKHIDQTLWFTIQFAVYFFSGYSGHSPTPPLLRWTSVLCPRFLCPSICLWFSLLRLYTDASSLADFLFFSSVSYGCQCLSKRLSLPPLSVCDHFFLSLRRWRYVSHIDLQPSVL